VCSVPQSEIKAKWCLPAPLARQPFAFMGQISAASPDWSTPDTIPARQLLTAQLATQLCRSTFERAGGREVKQMDSAYSTCLLVTGVLVMDQQ